jgi:phosphoribosylformimino-5-aminoimidazole carboxamide ribonucleotide (ProFAR) isomerase
VKSLRNLNGDQNKTVVQIRSFLDQAQRALHNGDVDGAHTLATKAKTLLDELTGAS